MGLKAEEKAEDKKKQIPLFNKTKIRYRKIIMNKMFFVEQVFDPEKKNTTTKTLQTHNCFFFLHAFLPFAVKKIKQI